MQTYAANSRHNGLVAGSTMLTSPTVDWKTLTNMPAGAPVYVGFGKVFTSRYNPALAVGHQYPIRILDDTTGALIVDAQLPDPLTEVIDPNGSPQDVSDSIYAGIVGIDAAHVYCTYGVPMADSPDTYWTHIYALNHNGTFAWKGNIGAFELQTYFDNLNGRSPVGLMVPMATPLGTDLLVGVAGDNMRLSGATGAKLYNPWPNRTAFVFNWGAAVCVDFTAGRVYQNCISNDPLGTNVLRVSDLATGDFLWDGQTLPNPGVETANAARIAMSPDGTKIAISMWYILPASQNYLPVDALYVGTIAGDVWTELWHVEFSPTYESAVGYWPIPFRPVWNHLGNLVVPIGDTTGNITLEVRHPTTGAVLQSIQQGIPRASCPHCLTTADGGLVVTYTAYPPGPGIWGYKLVNGAYQQIWTIPTPVPYIHAFPAIVGSSLYINQSSYITKYKEASGSPVVHPPKKKPPNEIEAPEKQTTTGP